MQLKKITTISLWRQGKIIKQYYDACFVHIQNYNTCEQCNEILTTDQTTKLNTSLQHP